MTRRSYDVAGKVVLSTGGTGGIGNATARELIRRGAKVAIVDIDRATPQLAEQMSPHSAMGVVADVRTRSELDRAVAEAVDRFGRVDVAIANAGILPPTATLRTTPISSIDSAFAVNVTGVVNAVQAAVGQLGRDLRVELAGYGVTTTVAYFSLIDSDMIKQGIDDDPAADDLLAALPKALRRSAGSSPPHWIRIWPVNGEPMPRWPSSTPDPTRNCSTPQRRQPNTSKGTT